MERDLTSAPEGEPWTAHAETHISGIVFAGGYAYKQLKAIRTPFLDHSTEPQRRVAVEEELELNRRIAPDVYLGTVSVPGPGGGDGDHLLVMMRMPAARSLARLVDDPEFDDHLRAVARRVAAFHAQLEPDDDAVAIASADSERRRWRSNLDELADLATAVGRDLDTDLADIGRLAMDYLDHRDRLFASRATAGMARDGHGDLLAADIFCLPDGPRILDCLAFDPDLRKGDVLADIAFLVMDIERLAGPRPAQRLLRWYQEFADEHHPGSLAHFYIAYRALVRAKIHALRHAQTRDAADRFESRNHLAQCRTHLERAQVRVVLVGGGPGTGKSTVSDAIVDTLGWALLGSDTTRKERAGLPAHVHALAAPDQGLYSATNTDETYAAMLDRAAILCDHGESVVLDASWSRAAHRDAARAMARAHHAQIIEIECALDPAIAKERIVRRLSSPWTISDATPEIVDHLAAIHDPWPEARIVDTSTSLAHSRSAAVGAALGFG